MKTSHLLATALVKKIAGMSCEDQRQGNAYKVLDSDYSCRGFKYEVGKTYKHDGPIKLCSSGFHACQSPVDCFNYYGFDPKNHVVEVEMRGEVVHGTGKSACSEIEILRELSWEEVLRLVNTGSGNSGHRNSGNCNSGNWNSGNWNSGFFNTDEQCVRMFNKPTKMRRNDVSFPGCFYFDVVIWVPSDEMTDDEKEGHPEHETTGGYRKTRTLKEAWAEALKDLSDEDRKMILALPNYDPDIFEEITGVRVE